MKTTTKSFGITISKLELETMTTQVKECIAFDCIKQKGIFSAADLWNIQRQGKKASIRRHQL